MVGTKFRENLHNISTTPDEFELIVRRNITSMASPISNNHLNVNCIFSYIDLRFIVKHGQSV